MGPSTPFLTPHLHRWQTHCGLSHGLRRNREVLSAKIYSRVIIREREKKEKGEKCRTVFIGVLRCTKATQSKSLKSPDDSSCANEKIRRLNVSGINALYEYVDRQCTLCLVPASTVPLA